VCRAGTWKWKDSFSIEERSERETPEKDSLASVENILEKEEREAGPSLFDTPSGYDFDQRTVGMYLG